MLTRTRLTLGDAAATAPVSRWSLCADQTTSTTKIHDQRRIDAGKTCSMGTWQAIPLVMFPMSLGRHLEPNAPW